MVKDIICKFEKTFDKFANTTNAFTHKFFKNEDAAIATLCFADFNVEFEYSLECGSHIGKSGLNIVLDFSKRMDIPFRCMMYDIINLIDEKNFNCWFYCYIENQDRMEICFNKLINDFKAVLPQLCEFAKSKSNLDNLLAVLRTNIKTSVGVDIIKEWQDEFDEFTDINIDDAYSYLYNIYFDYEQSIFSNTRYRDFLAGDWKKALRKYEGKKNLLVYEQKIVEYISNQKSAKVILTEEYECLKDGLRESESTGGLWPFLCSCLVLIIPFMAICIGIYYLLGYVIYKNCIYATPMEWYNILFCLIPTVCCCGAASYLLRDRIFRKFFRKKYKKMLDYDSILVSEHDKKRVRLLCYIVYVIALVFVFLFVNNGISFSENGIRDKNGLVNIVGTYHSYSDVSNLTYENKQSKNYTINYYDGSSLDLSQCVPQTQIEKNILPIFEENNIEIVKK